MATKSIPIEASLSLPKSKEANENDDSKLTTGTNHSIVKETNLAHDPNLFTNVTAPVSRHTSNSGDGNNTEEDGKQTSQSSDEGQDRSSDSNLTNAEIKKDQTTKSLNKSSDEQNDDSKKSLTESNLKLQSDGKKCEGINTVIETKGIGNSDDKTEKNNNEGEKIEGSRNTEETSVENHDIDIKVKETGDSAHCKNETTDNNNAKVEENIHAKEIAEKEALKKEKKMPSSTSNIEEDGDKKKHTGVDLKPPPTKPVEKPKSAVEEDINKKYPAEVDLQPPSNKPVDKPNPHDILFGRGGLTNHHPGNRLFRDIVALHKEDYMKAIKIVKPRVARRIIKIIRNGDPPGRFLKKSSNNLWYDVGDRNAAEKASQALREKSQDEKKETKAKAKARYKKKDDDFKNFGNLIPYGNMPMPANPAMYGKGGGTMIPPFPYAPQAMYGFIPPNGVQMPLLPTMPPYAAAAGMNNDGSPFYPYAKKKNSDESTPDKTEKNLDKDENKDEEEDKGKDEDKVKGKDETKDEEKKNGKDEVKDGGKAPRKTETSATNDVINPEKSAQLNVLQPTYPTKGGVFGAGDEDGNIIVTDHDILCGRGGATNHHKGNKRFRDIVGVHRPDYVRAPKVQKPGVARLIVRAIRSGNPPGRFLKKNPDGKWVDIGDKRAAEKASQALREKPPEERTRITQTSTEYFSFFAQQGAAAAAAYGMHPSNLPGHTYVYPGYPPSMVPQQMNPSMPHVMHPLYLPQPGAKNPTTTTPSSNNEKKGEKKKQGQPKKRVVDDGGADKEAKVEGIEGSNSVDKDVDAPPQNNPAKRQKLEEKKEEKEEKKEEVKEEQEEEEEEPQSIEL